MSELALIKIAEVSAPVLSAPVRVPNVTLSTDTVTGALDVTRTTFEGRVYDMPALIVIGVLIGI